MPEQDQRSRAAVAPGATHGPYWRALLETRWRERLQEVTELSLAYHAADPDGRCAGPSQHAARRLLRRTVAARRGLADVEEALGRLAAGNFGYCEQCGSPVPAGLLSATPETRYCPSCAAVTAPASALPAMFE
jgi:RNA polymerase-binding transcription factor DksA